MVYYESHAHFLEKEHIYESYRYKSLRFFVIVPSCISICIYRNKCHAWKVLWNFSKKMSFKKVVICICMFSKDSQYFPKLNRNCRGTAAVLLRVRKLELDYSHKNFIVTKFVSWSSTSLVSQSLYSLDLIPCDSDFFRSLD